MDAVDAVDAVDLVVQVQEAAKEVHHEPEAKVVKLPQKEVAVAKKVTQEVAVAARRRVSQRSPPSKKRLKVHL